MLAIPCHGNNEPTGCISFRRHEVFYSATCVAAMGRKRRPGLAEMHFRFHCYRTPDLPAARQTRSRLASVPAANLIVSPPSQAAADPLTPAGQTYWP